MPSRNHQTVNPAPDRHPERRRGLIAIFVAAWLLVAAFMVWQLSGGR